VNAYNLILGRNISGDRGRLQLSQTAVAARMRALGFTDWHQQTVASVEKGKRRVTLEEVLGLVEALETTLPRLLSPINGDLWVELPSGSGHDLPSMEVINLANGAKGGTGAVGWSKNAPVRAPVPPREIEGVRWSGPAAALRPEPQTVVAGIVTSDRGVLVTRRVDQNPPWGFTAGWGEPGESPEDTIIREVKEEADLRIQVGEYLGERDHPVTGKHMVYYAARPTHGTEIHLGDKGELTEVRWVSLAEADELLPGMFGPVREHLARELGEG
jgi:8-oxo-dGTP pyrophosphatase MutT (NUDIX family)/transcriptional regulator with XRE-family HTH domain